MKEIIGNLDFTKIKNSSVKDTIQRMRRQPPTGRKYLQNTQSDKGLLSNIYKELSKLVKEFQSKIELEDVTGKSHTCALRKTKLKD